MFGINLVRRACRYLAGQLTALGDDVKEARPAWRARLGLAPAAGTAPKLTARRAKDKG